MLIKLFIGNFALIDKLEIEFGAGLNVLTGETGAGKSIIIDAVGVLMGGQALAEYIRTGEDKAIVEGVFAFNGSHKVMEVLDEFGLLPDEDEFLIISREIVRTGKNVCRINGRQVNLSVFKEITGNLVDIYGQHHQQSLLDPQKHVLLLDEYQGGQVITVLEELANLFREVSDLKTKAEKMAENEKEQARLADMYRFQVSEIDKCNPATGEDSGLEAEKKILANAEKLAGLSHEAYELLYEGRPNSVTELLHEAVNRIKEICLLDEGMRSASDTLESAMYQIEETARDIKNYADRIDTDSGRLEEVEARLDLIRQLKRKYGDSIEEILKYREQIASSLSVIDNFDEEQSRNKESLSRAMSRYDIIASQLTGLREKAASGLRTRITSELKELNMPHVTFDVKISRKSTPGVKGYDDIEFLISPNKGEPLKPLAKIVSGGEVSRIMLAFKTILAKIDSIGTLIFDEVDTGIGGETIHAVARKLAFIGNDRQVICVTHSPVIAGCGERHFKISKLTDKSRTYTQVKALQKLERVQEIARMLAGEKATEITRKLAEEILEKPD
ncbi:MAG: DNA repair protein RecN [Nitrospiraceae bacterium]|nr:MAG: DNA repair protein RecN [Nitrospiraceae bacterium]